MKNYAGFTLIELLMTLLIIGTLSAAAFSRFNPAIFTLRSASDDLVSAIRYTQQQAMSHGGLSLYAILINSNGYSVTRDGAADIDPMSGSNGFQQNWSDINFSPSLQITFDGQGDPGLAAPLTITLTQGTESRQVIIEKTTGFVR